MSSLFFTRRSPAARLRTAYRRYRSTPRHSIAGPLLLAVGIAFAGNHVAAASADQPSAAPMALTDAHSVMMLGSSRTAAMLGEFTTPTPSTLTFRAPWGGRGVATPVPERASRSIVRTAVPKPKPKVARKPRWVRPSGGPLTSPYGKRWGRMHEGLDFGAGYGSPVRAAYDGVIIAAGYDGGYGKQVRIRHAGGITTTYSHLSSILQSGGRVKAGDVVGKIGSTGASTGPHLHFEVLVGGSNVNPRPFLAARGVRI